MATDESMSTAQRELWEKHGTPEQFETAVWDCVPSMISVTEAEEAIEAYRIQWHAAASDAKPETPRFIVIEDPGQKSDVKACELSSWFSTTLKQRECASVRKT